MSIPLTAVWVLISSTEPGKVSQFFSVGVCKRPRSSIQNFHFVRVYSGGFLPTEWGHSTLIYSERFRAEIPALWLSSFPDTYVDEDFLSSRTPQPEVSGQDHLEVDIIILLGATYLLLG